MNYWKRFPGDYGRDTSHLTIAQHGAYALLLDVYYSTEKPLPADISVLSRMCRATTPDEQAAVKSVAEEFFPIGEDGKRHNGRADRQLEKDRAFAESQAQKARLPRKNSQKLAGANPRLSTGCSPDEHQLSPPVPVPVPDPSPTPSPNPSPEGDSRENPSPSKNARRRVQQDFAPSVGTSRQVIEHDNDSPDMNGHAIAKANGHTAVQPEGHLNGHINGKSIGSRAWDAYAMAYFERYGTEPVRNAKTNGQFSQLAKRLPADEVEHVVRWYLCSNTAMYVRDKHGTGLLLRDCEGLRTEWATGQTVTQTTAKLTDRKQNNLSVLEQLQAEMRAGIWWPGKEYGKPRPVSTEQPKGDS